MACGGNETDVKAKVKYEIEDILWVTTIYSNRIQCHFYIILHCIFLFKSGEEWEYSN